MKVLLHACCGPCTIYPLSVLHDAGHQVTAYFYNPNIHPFKEFEKRLATLSVYLREEGIELISEDRYGLTDFVRQVAFNEHKKCTLCYSMRLKKTALLAREKGFDCFTTTLLYSRYQDHSKLAEYGERLSNETEVKFYYEDFRLGWQSGIDASISRSMYRQPYCGCIYSEQERYDKSLKNF